MADITDIDYFDHWEATQHEFNEIFNRNPSLLGMIKGYMAEEKLKTMYLENNDKVQNLFSPDDHDRELKGDWRFDWEGAEDQHIVIEVKCLQSNYVKSREKSNGETVYSGKYQCDASDRREIDLEHGETVSTTLLEVGEFDILAVGIFEFGEKWDFVFAKNDDLPRTSYHKYTERARDRLIKGMHSLEYPLDDGSIYSEDIFALVKETVEEGETVAMDSGSDGPVVNS